MGAYEDGMNGARKKSPENEKDHIAKEMVNKGWFRVIDYHERIGISRQQLGVHLSYMERNGFDGFTVEHRHVNAKFGESNSCGITKEWRITVDENKKKENIITATLCRRWI